jgi:hypothetical protein
MERYFMSRTSAVALLVDTRRTMTESLQDKSAHEAVHDEQRLKSIERLLLDVRVGRVREFQLDHPVRMHIVVTD